jgi:hypothetical protein
MSGYPCGQSAALNGEATDLSHGSEFPCGDPIRPVPGAMSGDGRHRQWAYQLGYNTSQRLRSTEQAPLEAQEQLTALYDGVQLSERVYCGVE